MDVACALGSAVAYGAADFSGGVAAKRASAFGVQTVARLCGAAVMAALAVATHERVPSLDAALWAAAAGVVGGVALAAFYRALAGGKMGIVAPLTSITSAALPVLVALAIAGRPGAGAIAGMVLALVALWFISRPDGQGGRSGVGLALCAGAGFGLFLICIRQAGPDATFWPVAIASMSSLILSAVIVVVQGTPLPPARALPVVIAAGVLDSAGNALFVVASRHGRLDITAVLSSLYPAVTVLLARLLLAERLTRTQAAGMVLALAAIALIAAP